MTREQLPLISPRYIMQVAYVTTLNGQPPSSKTPLPFNAAHQSMPHMSKLHTTLHYMPKIIPIKNSAWSLHPLIFERKKARPV